MGGTERAVEELQLAEAAFEPELVADPEAFQSEAALASGGVDDEVAGQDRAATGGGDQGEAVLAEPAEGDVLDVDAIVGEANERGRSAPGGPGGEGVPDCTESGRASGRGRGRRRGDRGIDQEELRRDRFGGEEGLGGGFDGRGGGAGGLGRGDDSPAVVGAAADVVGEAVGVVEGQPAGIRRFVAEGEREAAEPGVDRDASGESELLDRRRVGGGGVEPEGLTWAAGKHEDPFAGKREGDGVGEGGVGGGDTPEGGFEAGGEGRGIGQGECRGECVRAVGADGDREGRGGGKRAGKGERIGECAEERLGGGEAEFAGRGGIRGDGGEGHEFAADAGEDEESVGVEVDGAVGEDAGGVGAAESGLEGDRGLGGSGDSGGGERDRDIAERAGGHLQGAASGEPGESGEAGGAEDADAAGRAFPVGEVGADQIEGAEVGGSAAQVEAAGSAGGGIVAEVAGSGGQVAITAAGRVVAVGFEVEVEGGASDRGGDLEFRGPAAFAEFRVGEREERGVDAERVCLEPVGEGGMGWVRSGGGGFAAGDAVGAEAPEEESEVGEVPPTLLSARRAEVDGVGGTIEGGVDAVHDREVADVGGADAVGGGGTAAEGVGGGVEAEVVGVLGPAEELEELDGTGAPAGDVAGDFLQDGEGAFATAVVDGFRDVGAAAGAGFVEGVVADQVAEVGDDPVGTGFDEEIVPQTADVVVEEAGLAAGQFEERAEGVAAGGVLGAVGLGEQLVEVDGFRVRGHQAGRRLMIAWRLAATIVGSSRRSKRR